MAQPIQKPGPKPGWTRRNEWKPPAGPVLPGELQPAAPYPASSKSGDPPIATEQELLRQLVRHYRWCWVGQETLRRYNPFGRMIRAEVEALDDE